MGLRVVVTSCPASILHQEWSYQIWAIIYNRNYILNMTEAITTQLGRLLPLSAMRDKKRETNTTSLFLPTWCPPAKEEYQQEQQCSLGNTMWSRMRSSSLLNAMRQLPARRPQAKCWPPTMTLYSGKRPTRRTSRKWKYKTSLTLLCRISVWQM